MIKGVFIDLDFENEDLLITTDSTPGQQIRVYVFDRTSDVKISAFWIEFAEPYSYHVGKCTENGKVDQFQVSLPTDTEKIWKISEKLDSLEINCNGLQILNYEFASGYQNNCATQWGLDAARIQFATTDTASKSYRITRKLIPSKYR